MNPQELQRRSAATEAVIRDLEGAGLLSHPKVDRQAIIDGLLRGDDQDPHVQNYMALQHYVDPDTEIRGHEDAPFGVSPEDIRSAAHRDFQGRGWSVDEMRDLGRDVQQRELSPGSRQAQEWERRRNLVSGLIDAKKPGLHNLPIPGLVALRTALTETPEAAFERTRDAKIGESGWIGAVENPEYLAGDYITRYGQPVVDYLGYGLDEGRDWGDADRLSQMRTKAAKMSNTLATKIPSHYDTSTPSKKEEAYKAVKGIYEGLKPMSYDDAQRKRTGEYPSYGWSTGVSFVRNSADPSIVPGMAAGLTEARALSHIPKIAAKSYIKDGLIDEVPSSIGLSGLFGAFNSIPARPFTPGNESRTDLYNPETGRPETDNEFSLKLQANQKKRSQAEDHFQTYQKYGHPLMTR